MKKSIFLFLVCTIVSLKAQDTFFLNTNQSLLSLNPSFAGSNGGFRNQFSYRNQWPNLSGNYNTFLNSTDLYLSGIKAGIGASVLKSAFGPLTSRLYSLSYAQYLNFKGGKIKIVPSLQMSYGYRNINDSWIIYPSGQTGQGSVLKQEYIGLSTGVLVNYGNKLFFGSSLFNANQPDVGLSGTGWQAPSLNLHVSYNLEYNRNLRLQLFYLMNIQQKFYTHRFAINALSFDHLILGLACNNFDSPIFNAGYRSNFFTVLVGYDYTVSKLTGNIGGSWELHASFNLRSKDLRRSVTSFETW